MIKWKSKSPKGSEIYIYLHDGIAYRYIYAAIDWQGSGALGLWAMLDWAIKLGLATRPCPLRQLLRLAPSRAAESWSDGGLNT